MLTRRRFAWAAIAIAAVACTVAGILSRQWGNLSPAGSGGAVATNLPNAKGRHALLIGCAQYTNPSIPSLAGPTNDVRLMKDVLIESYGFSAESITTLVGPATAADAPTRANIARAFQKLEAAAQADDQVFILLAGHGSQQPNAAADADDLEPDGLDEIFLPIDAGRWSGGPGTVANAIVDDEIYRWTSAIAAKGAWVSVVFDCCCAGTAIRGEYQEAARYVSPENDLGVPAPRAGPNEATGAVSAQEPAVWEADGSERIVALYACGSREAEPELALPPGEQPRQKHGLLTYALCNVLSQSRGRGLTYNDLGREIWLKYRGWGRASPTPSLAGTKLARPVLGVGQSAAFRVVRKSGPGWLIDGGQLHGLTPGSILAIQPPHTAEQAGERACYARILSAEPTRAVIAPCAYQRSPVMTRLHIGARCELEFTDFGDMRIAVAVDHRGISEAGSELAAIERSLHTLSAAPNAAIRIADDLASAEWVVVCREGAWQLLPKSAAGMDEAFPLPLSTPSLTLDRHSLPASLEAQLNRVFRTQNLLRLAGSVPHASGGAREPLKVNLKFRPLCDDPAADGTCMWLPDGVRLTPNEQVEWVVTNEGASSVDLTLLFIDSQLRIAAVFPAAGDLVPDNRLSPGDSRSIEAQVNADTLGIEHLVAIAVRGRGPQQDFRWLAEPTLAAARGARPETPLVRLLEHAVFTETLGSSSLTRGLSSSDALDSLFVLRTWTVVPK